MGSMDPHSIITLALQRLGPDDYRPDTPTGRVCLSWYKHTLALACARYNWTFCAREQVLEWQLHAHDVHGVETWERPAGCLKILYCWDDNGMIPNWRLTLHGIVIEEPEAILTHVRKPADRWDPAVYGREKLWVRYQCDLAAIEWDVRPLEPNFTQAVICLLASHLAIAIGSRAQLGQVLAQEAEVYFQRAITHDRQQDWAFAQSPRRLFEMWRGEGPAAGGWKCGRARGAGTLDKGEIRVR